MKSLQVFTVYRASNEGVQRQVFSLVGQKLSKDYAYNLMLWAKECCEKWLSERRCEKDVMRKPLWESHCDKDIVRRCGKERLWESRCERDIIMGKTKQIDLTVAIINIMEPVF